MAKDTKVNNDNVLQGNVTTANDLAVMLNGNYRTVRKILERMEADNIIRSTTVKRANRDTIAYYINNTTIKAVQAELKNIRKAKNSIVDVRNTNANTNVRNSNITRGNNLNNLTGYYNTNYNTNVKLYEVMEKNHELSNELKEVKEQYSKEREKAVQLEADLRIANSNIKLIESKQSSFEAENARLQQELEKTTDEFKSEKEKALKLEVEVTSLKDSVEVTEIANKSLEKDLHNRDIIIAVLAGLLLIIITVISMLMFIR